ncbi:MAG: metallophosphoesterase family protein, partial [Candidatus Omnitrophica bacterium]|nr:metallophosphoesterase family protein [Candidatus Omnitrophota bacterium]
MLILVISDIHGDVSVFQRLAEKTAQAEMVLVCGDLTNFRGKEEAAKVVRQLKHFFPKVLAVAGNCDEREVEDYLKEQGLSLHGQARVIENVGFLGTGFSLACPVYTPGEVSEDDFKESLEKAYAQLPEKIPFILVTHQPPYGTKLDLVHSGQHVGSQFIRNFIEEKKPCLAF